MMKGLIILAILSVSSANIDAQCPVSWLGSDVESTGNGAQSTDYSKISGKAYIGGTYDQGTMQFGNFTLPSLTTAPGRMNTYLTQLNNEGDVDWIFRIGQSLNPGGSSRLLATPNGVIAGYLCIDSIYVGGNLIITNAENALLVSVNASGEFNWIHHLQSQGLSQISSIVSDEMDNLFVLGVYSMDLDLGSNSLQVVGNAQQMDGELFLAKIKSDGSIHWLQHIGGGIGNNVSVSMTYKTGHLYLTGFFSEELQMGQFMLNNSTGSSGFVAQCDTSGNVQWVNKISSNYLRPFGIIVLGNRIILGGVFDEVMSYQDEEIISHGGTDGFLLALSTNGNFIQARSIGGIAQEGIIDLELASDGLALSTCYFQSDTLTIDGLNLNNYGSLGNSFAMLIDSELIVSCVLPIHSSVNSTSFIEHISFDTIALVGGFSENITISNTSLEFDGGSTFFAKTCMGCSDLIKLDIEEPLTNSPALHIYPNPASQSVRIHLSGNSQQINAVEVTDMLGHAVLHQRLAPTGQQIDISGLASGIYTLAATLQSGETLRQRLVVQH